MDRSNKDLLNKKCIDYFIYILLYFYTANIHNNNYGSKDDI